MIEGVCPICEKLYEKEYKFNSPVSGEIVEVKEDECFPCRIEQEDREMARQALKENAERAAQRVFRVFDNESLMNDKLKPATFESYQPTSEELAKSKAIAERYANNFSKENPVSLLLIGNYGTGKSHLAVSVTKRLMEKKFSCIFISTPKLMTKLRSTYNKDSDVSEDQIIDSLTKVDCLVLDDIGAESTKASADNQHSWATSKLFEIIDNRIGKHTIFTSNFEPDELQKRLGGRNFSRMMEDTHVIKMYGDDYRLKDFK